MATSADKAKAEAKRYLKEWRIRPNETVYTILRHVSASGMYRVLDVVIIRKGKPCSIWYDTAIALGYKVDRKHNGLGTTGCGMDMGYEVVHNLGYLLWPKGTRKPFGTRNGEPDSSGGFALKHSWL